LQRNCELNGDFKTPSWRNDLCHHSLRILFRTEQIDSSVKQAAALNDSRVVDEKGL
jgi:hypothetical protein